MEVATVSEIQSELAKWLHAVRSGKDVTITDQGVAIAKLTQPSDNIESLIKSGAITLPANTEIVNPQDHVRPRVTQSLSDIIITGLV